MRAGGYNLQGGNFVNGLMGVLAIAPIVIGAITQIVEAIQDKPKDGERKVVNEFVENGENGEVVYCVLLSDGNILRSKSPINSTKNT